VPPARSERASRNRPPHLRLVQLLQQSKPAARRHEWHNDNDHYDDDGCITTNPQATTYRPRTSPAVWFGASATPSSHEWQVESKGGSGADRPRSDVREPEEPHRGARGRRGVRGGRGTPLWCARLYICYYTRPSRPYMRRSCATAEDAQKQVRGLEENVVHLKYIELVRVRCPPSAPLGSGAECSQFAEFKRMEREHQKEKQKLVKDKDAGMLHQPHFFFRPLKVFICNAAKSQLTKANQTKIKMENLARELQKVRHVSSANADTIGSSQFRTGQQAVEGE
jgi:hypothetical protein